MLVKRIIQINISIYGNSTELFIHLEILHKESFITEICVHFSIKIPKTKTYRLKWKVCNQRISSLTYKIYKNLTMSNSIPQPNEEQYDKVSICNKW